MLEPSRSLFATAAPVCFGLERRHWGNWNQRFLSIMLSTLSLSSAIRTKRCAGLQSKGLETESESLVNIGRSSRSSPARHALASSMSGPRGVG